MDSPRRAVAGVLSALALCCTPALGAEMVASRDIEVAGDDVAAQLARPVADMERELARRGCLMFSRAYWSDRSPLRTLHVEVPCKEVDDERVSLR